MGLRFPVFLQSSNLNMLPMKKKRKQERAFNQASQSGEAPEKARLSNSSA